MQTQGVIVFLAGATKSGIEQQISNKKAIICFCYIMQLLFDCAEVAVSA